MEIGHNQFKFIYKYKTIRFKHCMSLVCRLNLYIINTKKQKQKNICKNLCKMYMDSI